jgi:hypothetical protein
MAIANGNILTIVVLDDEFVYAFGECFELVEQMMELII